MQRFGSIKRGIHYRHIGRYGEIVSALVKYGFDDLLSRLNIERYLSAGKRILRGKKSLHVQVYSKWDRIRMVIEELGPTFIKLGQFASNRPDILPAELIIALEKLQDSVGSFPEQDAVKTIEQELGRPIGSLFKEFAPKPFASASMAQVHKATLHDGAEVAVKVQRPRLTESVTVDLEIMYHLASLIEKHYPHLDVFDPMQLVNEFANGITKELDFSIEASHIDRFAHNFKDDETILITKVYHELTSRKVITTEFIHGIKITHINELIENGLDPKDIAARGAAIVLKQIFKHGFFHADPHAGNILVTKGNRICFLDLGMTGILTPTSRERLSSIIIGVASREPQRIVKTLLEMADHQIEGKDELEYKIAELVEEYASKALGKINIGEVLNTLSQLLAKHRLKVVPGFYLLVKAVVTMEGIGYKLDPSFNMMRHIEPFAARLVKDQYKMSHLSKEGLETAQELFFLIRDFPGEVRELMQLVKIGKLKIGFEHKGLDPMLRKFDQIINRLVFGLVLAALLIGSSIVVLSKVPPAFYGIPVIGIIGFTASLVMAFWLLLTILKHERM
ncbi:MAG: ABC1 kinase family protein [Fibrobacterota bacterium]|nr:AarF/UbiB family protein [Chitinispirillaceae bacterium]